MLIKHLRVHWLDDLGLFFFLIFFRYFASLLASSALKPVPYALSFASLNVLGQQLPKDMIISFIEAASTYITRWQNNWC